MFTSFSDVSNVNGEADILANEADAIENDQQSFLESSSLELQYETLLKDYIIQKHDQVERIEEKLGQLLQKQQFQMQKILMAKPNILSLSKTKRLWQGQVTQQKSSIARIEGRLTNVKDIKSSMGLHEPRIEELASRKLRLKEPNLFKEYELSKVLERTAANVARRKEDEKKRSKKASKKAKVSLSRAKASPL